jgi:uracil-DNA glycosylase
MENELMLLHEEITGCNRCPRLREYCAGVAETKVKRYRDQEYWGRPVPGFGDPAARLLVLGLAPGAHGANRTGRMFTGDDSGVWLYGALHARGFANQSASGHRDDGLALTGAYIANAARCAPPGNKPLPGELEACRPFLARELALLGQVRVVLVLGRIAFEAYLRVLKGQGHAVGRPVFAHGAEHRFADPGLPGLLCSYHPSRQNTNTKKLTPAMWNGVFARARELADG